MKNKQLVISQFGDDIQTSTKIIESEVHLPKGTQVLVKNHYVGINALYDRQLYRGKVPYIDVKFPFVFGVEATGELVAIGEDVKNYKVGDTVGTVKVGTAYQEYQCIDEVDLISFPNSTADYLTMSPTGVSADLAIKMLAEIREGDLVLVSAAAGGLGHILVQLCKHRSCKVIAICGSEKKKAMLEELGVCHEVINYRQTNLEDRINEAYNNKIDVAFDSVGGKIFDLFLKNLANKGRLIVIGLASELSNPSFEMVHAPRVYASIYWKGASVRCFMNHLYKEKHAASRQELFSLYQKGELKIKVDESKFVGIESIVEASQYLLSGKSCGKVIVEL